ncbi:MAG: hypothetical protein HQK62_10910 [Desulfamplus sp.]|nr:hypothetical protein [Desulfamplus sp.]
MQKSKVIEQIRKGSEKGKKNYKFNDTHDEKKIAQMWFQQSEEGLVLFVVFYTLACRWSRCLGCNLPSKVSGRHIPYNSVMAQIDDLFSRPDVVAKKDDIKKIIISNNGSILDEDTFSSTALMYLLAKVNMNLHNLEVFAIETRPEYVDVAELEFMARALAEGETETRLEIILGFEAFDDNIRNNVFDKGLSLDVFEKFVESLSPFEYSLKCYFMQKPVPYMDDEAAVEDIRLGIEYLSSISRKYRVPINIHLNPTYVATGTVLEEAFKQGDYTPPYLIDVARAALYARDKDVSVFIGLSDEGLTLDGGSFIRAGEGMIVQELERFNQTGDYDILESLVKS